MPEIPEALAPKEDRGQQSAGLIRWHTIRYRVLAVWSSVGLILLVTVLLLVFPQWRTALGNWIFGGSRSAGNLEDLLPRQARFTNLDGAVRVRKAKQVEWVAANFSTNLDKGDMVQTSQDGVARIAFADGTLYVVKPDTLIVIEENAVPTDRGDSRVSVQVTSGVVDLSTSQLGGQSLVMFADAEARIRQQSRALVSNHPETNTHQITVSKGGAELQRGGERIELGEYEQASFAGPESPTEKRKIVAPPVLLTPANMAPVVMTGAQAVEVQFTWSTVAGADVYRLRISRSPIFSALLYDRQLSSTSVRVPSFKEGDYYWAVASIDSQRKESQESEPNQFSVIRQENEGEILLQVERYIQHGKVIEIIGRTEPGATVLVNNEPVFNVAPNGSFKHFTTPLPNVGPNLISITAQNSQGKIATLRKTITIQ